MKRTIILLTILGLLIAGYFYRQSTAVTAVPAASVTEFLSGESSGAFTLATEPNAIEFPRDLGAHPDFQTEWWYYTGNLETEDGRQFGYQFTIFRRAIAEPDDLQDESSWRTEQIYFAHAAIADISEDRFLAGDQISRGAAGLSGATAEPYEVWIENWSVKEIAPGVHEMQAEKGGTGFKFELRETQPPVLHGLGGLSQKSEGVGKASYYYSLIGLETSGELWIGDERFSVSGTSWKDHEYITNSLGDEAIGWDWFSVQFDNEEALMFSKIRSANGAIDPFSPGSWIDADSNITALSESDINVTTLATWRSPKTGAEYPSSWIVQIPEKGVELQVKTLIQDAELVTGIGITYWEGPAYYEGTLNGQPISGYGYIELTGYVQPIDL